MLELFYSFLFSQILPLQIVYVKNQQIFYVLFYFHLINEAKKKINNF